MTTGTVANDRALRRFRGLLEETHGNRIDRVVLFGSRVRCEARRD